uniref:HMA domain-containing protein n=1 Tax=Oryza meridionalis TaxID=40149 RepID=A0A0E0EQ31_9ORYZ
MIKVEIKVPMTDERKKSKVMQIIAKHSGILSITADRDKDKVTIVGNENMDVTCLTMELRKYMRRTYIVIDTVTPVDEKKEKEEKEKKEKEEKEKKEKEEKEKKKKEEEQNNPKIVCTPYYVHMVDEPSPSCCQM